MVIIKVVKKSTKYYRDNIEVLRENGRNKYRNVSEKEKEVQRKYQRVRYHMNTDLYEKLRAEMSKRLFCFKKDKEMYIYIYIYIYIYCKYKYERKDIKIW